MSKRKAIELIDKLSRHVISALNGYLKSEDKNSYGAGLDWSASLSTQTAQAYLATEIGIAEWKWSKPI